MKKKKEKKEETIYIYNKLEKKLKIKL